MKETLDSISSHISCDCANDVSAWQIGVQCRMPCPEGRPTGGGIGDGIEERSDTAWLRNEGRMVFFSFGGRDIRFLGAKCLNRFTAIRKWHDGYLEVMADNGGRLEEDYIDLVPILENLYIDPARYLKPIRKVELNYV